jgi:hypothetical protein
MPWRRMGEWMIHIFLTSALVGGEWSSWRTGRFTPGGIALSTHLIGWVVPGAGLDAVEKKQFLTLTGLELRSLGRSARSQSLFGLRYPGSWYAFSYTKFYEEEDNPLLLQHTRNQKSGRGNVGVRPVNQRSWDHWSSQQSALYVSYGMTGGSDVCTGNLWRACSTDGTSKKYITSQFYNYSCRFPTFS